MATQTPLSPAANDLGFGGADLAQQQTDETEEERRRRLLGLARGGSNMSGLAASQLFGLGS